MKTSKTNLIIKSALRISVFMLLLAFVFPSAYSNYSEEIVKFKPEYRIKRIPDGTVTIYTLNDDGKKEEFIFRDFNADVVLSIYRRVAVSQITSNLAKKYVISEDESRRGIKRVLNALYQLGMMSE